VEEHREGYITSGKIIVDAKEGRWVGKDGSQEMRWRSCGSGLPRFWAVSAGKLYYVLFELVCRWLVPLALFLYSLCTIVEPAQV